MAKGKNLNPADAYRKSLRKKELKKNKAERSKNREFALVKKDTQDLEENIQRLEATATADLSAADRTRLAELKDELEKINKKKEEYVKEHPEHRKLVYRARKHDAQATMQEEAILQKRNLFKKNGLPRHPERSIYYDPVMNPFGVAPPGMPYMERPLRPDEMESDDEDDDEIAMPKGPPPALNVNDSEEVVNSDDEIAMPDGPPSEALSQTSMSSAISSMPLPNPAHTAFTGVPPPTFPPPPTSLPPLPPLPSISPLPPLPPFPPLPPGPPPSFAPGMMPGYSMHATPPQAFFGIPPPYPPFPPPPPGVPLFQPMPPPPPGFFPPRQQLASAMQDPLSSVPHTSIQAYQARPLTHPSLPPKPTQTTTPDASTSMAAATVSAAPQLRDLKKEATAFIPTSLKRKKAGIAGLTKVNAAPSDGSDAASSELAGLARPDLLGTLKHQFRHSSGPSANGKTDSQVVVKPKDDYQKFVEGMGDLL